MLESGAIPAMKKTPQWTRTMSVNLVASQMVYSGHTAISDLLLNLIGNDLKNNLVWYLLRRSFVVKDYTSEVESSLPGAQLDITEL